MLLTMPKHEMIQTLTMMMEAELEYKETYDEEQQKFVGTIDFLSTADENDDDNAEIEELDGENEMVEEDEENGEGKQSKESEPFKVDGLFDDLEIDFSDDDETKNPYTHDNEEIPFGSIENISQVEENNKILEKEIQEDQEEHNLE